jgi:hypothetical protein
MPYTRENAVALWSAIWRIVNDQGSSYWTPIETVRLRELYNQQGDAVPYDPEWRSERDRRLAAYRARHGRSEPHDGTVRRWHREYQEEWQSGYNARVAEYRASRDAFFAQLTPEAQTEIQIDGWLHAFHNRAYLTNALPAYARQDAEYEVQRLWAVDREIQARRERRERERLEAIERERRLQAERNKHKARLSKLVRDGIHPVMLLTNIKAMLRALRSNAPTFPLFTIQSYSVQVIQYSTYEGWVGYCNHTEFVRKHGREKEEWLDYLNDHAARHKWPDAETPRFVLTYDGRVISHADMREIEVNGETVICHRQDIGGRIQTCHYCECYMFRHDAVPGNNYLYCSLEHARAAHDAITPRSIMNYSTDILTVYGREFCRVAGEKDSLFLGVENEVLPLSDYADVAERVRQELQERVICKTDGSIDGFEIVSLPGTLAWHKELWTPWFDAGDSVEDLEGKRIGYGMHVHMSRNALTQFAWAKLNVFVNAPENAAFITRIAQRPATNYCGRQKKRIAYLDDSQNHGRYSALNFQTRNNATVEFRIFQANVAKAGFFKNLEFCHASARWAALASVKYLHHDEFTEWLNRPDNKATYPYLHKFIANQFKESELCA